MGSSLRPGRPHALPRVHGFNLLELLMVIAIVGTMAAMLCHKSSRARTSSKSIVCHGNLHELGLALGMYLGDSAAIYPYVSSLPAPNPRGASFWFDALAPHLSDARWGQGVLRCPACSGITYDGEIKSNGRGQITSMYCPCGSYAYNASGRRLPTQGSAGLLSSGLGFSLSEGRPIEQPVREADVKMPADLYAFGDAPLFTAPWGTVAGLRLGGAADYDSLVAEDVTSATASHGLVFTMLFADTHTENIKTQILLGSASTHRARWNHDHLP